MVVRDSVWISWGLPTVFSRYLVGSQPSNSPLLGQQSGFVEMNGEATLAPIQTSLTLPIMR